MKKVLAVLLVYINLLAINAQTQPDRENPEVFAINKENPRSTALPFPTEALAAKNNYQAPLYNPVHTHPDFG